MITLRQIAVALVVLIGSQNGCFGSFHFTSFTSSQDLNIAGATHFQTCAEIPGLVSFRDVLNKDSTLINQITEVDFPNPRQTITYNLTRSIFEEVVRRRDELTYQLQSSQDRLKDLEERIKAGLEPDSSGQLWLLISMTKADIERLSKDLNATIAKDMDLFQTRTVEYRAIWPHNNYESHADSCDDRIRLTPAAPHSTGSMWHKTKQHVTNGFNTTFKFQISARSLDCVTKVEAKATQQRGTVMTYHYSQCDEVGADGFAFVIQNDRDQAIGGLGGRLGFEGIPDSVAFEFDLAANRDMGDPNDMHVSVHVKGCRAANSADTSSRIAFFSDVRELRANLVDGLVHTGRIVYTPGLTFDPERQQFWKASTHLGQFIKQDGIGTVRVFLDDMEEAIINFPISLKYAMKLDAGRAWVGFTAATGSKWQNHDILDWSFESL